MVKGVVRVLLSVSFSATGGCKFTEVVNAPPGDPVLVVQAVLNAARQDQSVLVQRSQAGETQGGIGGAVVELTDLDPRSCPAPTVLLAEVTSSTPGAPPTGLYQTPFCPLEPGDRVTLRVVTPDAHVVTGSTRIPGIRSIVIRAGGTEAQFAPASLAMDRTRDSLSVTVDLMLARALQLEAVRATAGEDPSLSVTTDTTSVSVPGDLVDLSGDGRAVFRAGAYYEVTAAALDTNYFDFVRTITNPLTGRGFINHLTGAVGVFGSIAPLTYELRVTAPRTDPREGVYRLTGRVRGFNVDVTWDVYRDPLARSYAFQFFAFVDGQWVGGPVRTSANGVVGDTLFAGEMFGPTDIDIARPTYSLTGTRAPRGAPFRVMVTLAGRTRVDTITAVQVSGPS